MKKLLLTFGFLFTMALAAYSQGILVVSEKPTSVTPHIFGYSEWAWDYENKTIYIYDRDSLDWLVFKDNLVSLSSPITVEDIEYDQLNSALLALANTSGSSGMDSLYNGDRNILRVPTAGQNLGASTFREWMNWWYFTPPTLSMNSLSPSVIEMGTSQAYTIAGSTTNNGNATLSNGDVDRTFPSTAQIATFGAGTSYSQGITYTPLQTPSGDYTEGEYRFRASQDWVKGVESGTATSSTRTIIGVYPVFYGLSATDLSAAGNVYTDLTKLVTKEGSKTVSLTGSGFIYYALPASWSDNVLSSIIDHNGFNVTGSFTVYDINVSSSGLTNDWSTVAYKLYKLNTTTTASGFSYQFNQ